MSPAKSASRGGLRPGVAAARKSTKARARARGASRKQRLRAARRLKAQGLSSPAIGKRLGIAPSTVRDLLTDPTRSNAKRRQKNLSRRRARARVRAARGWKRGGPVTRNPGESYADFRKRQKSQRGVIVAAYVKRHKAATEAAGTEVKR